jgi:transposase
METQAARKPYPSDVTDEEWAFVAPYPMLMDEAAPQRRHDPREGFDALRWIVRTGAQWRYLPTNVPPWAAVYQQTQRWLGAGVFEAMVHDLRAVLRWTEGRADDPTAAIFAARTVQSTPESGARAGYGGYKRRKGRTTHAAVDTLGQLLARHVTPGSEQERKPVAILAEAVREATGEAAEVAFVDRGSTGEQAGADAAAHGIRPEAAKRGCVLLPRRWVIERAFAWVARFRRLARAYERLPETVAGPHFVAFARPMLHRLLPAAAPSP